MTTIHEGKKYSMITLQELQQLCVEYLSERGVTPESFQKNELQVLPIDLLMEKLHRRDVRNFPWTGGIWFPMGEQDGQAVFVGPTAGQDPSKDNKLSTKPKGVFPLFVPKQEWQETLWLCESPLKAIIMTQMGYCAIGGAGIWGIYSSKNGFKPGWPEDQILEGKIKRVCILFDNDWHTNDTVVQAYGAIRQGIRNHYPEAELQVLDYILPKELGSKIGIDDVYVHQGEQWVHDWIAKGGSTSETRLDKHLRELNAKYAVVEFPEGILNTENGNVLKESSFKTIEKNRCYKEMAPGGGGVKVVKVEPTVEWLEWELRRGYKRMTYAPGRPKELEGGLVYNEWERGPLEPLEPSGETPEEWVGEWLEMLHNAIPDKEEREYLINFAAYMLQRRGQTAGKCLMLLGHEQGTGKSLFVKCLGDMIGKRENFTNVDEEQLLNRFNKGVVDRELVLVDDVNKIDKKGQSLLKKLITDETVKVEEKNVKRYDIDAVATFFITSNSMNPIEFEKNNRRFVVIFFHPTVKYAMGDPWWDRKIDWLGVRDRDGDRAGVRKVMWYLLQRDLRGFNPAKHPVGAGAQEAELIGGCPIEQWLAEVQEDADSVLPDSRSCYTLGDIRDLIGEAAEGVTDKVLGTKLRLYEFRPAVLRKDGKGAQLITVNGKGRKAFWLLRGTHTTWTKEQVKADVEEHEAELKARAGRNISPVGGKEKF